MQHPPSVAVDPPLEPGEIDFLRTFVSQAEVRRVWRGQPSAASPWCPTDDGTLLELDEPLAVAKPDSVAAWLRWLSRTFLAPSTEAALTEALAGGLRGGHTLTGEVVIGDAHVVRVNGTRVSEVHYRRGEPSAQVTES